MVDKEKAINLAVKELDENKFKYIESTVVALYRERKLSIGAENKGWVVSFRLDVPESFEPDLVFVYVSDPEGEVYIPPII